MNQRSKGFNILTFIFLLVGATTLTGFRSNICFMGQIEKVNCIGSWGSWGSCSTSCGGGTQTQTYTVTTPASGGGTACPSANGATNSQSCNTQACCVGNQGTVCGSKPGYCLYACVLACGGCGGGTASYDSAAGWNCSGKGTAYYDCSTPPPESMYIQCDGSCS